MVEIMSWIPTRPKYTNDFPAGFKSNVRDCMQKILLSTLHKEN